MVENIAYVTVFCLCLKFPLKWKSKRCVIQVSNYNFPAKTLYAILIPEFSGCPLLCWTILIQPSLPVSVHTQDMSVFIFVDWFFYLYPQLSNFSHFEVNAVLPKSNDSEVSALFPWNQGSYIVLIVRNVVQTSKIWHCISSKVLAIFRVFVWYSLYGWVKLQIRYCLLGSLLFVAKVLDFL